MRRRVAIAVLVFAVGLTAGVSCGGDDEGSGTATGETNPAIVGTTDDPGRTVTDESTVTTTAAG